MQICVRLFKQAIRQPDVHPSTESTRQVSEVVAYEIVERRSDYINIPKDMQALNNHLIEIEEYNVIDVILFMEGLHTMGRYRFTNKLKLGLAVPFKLWSWMKGNNAGIATHFV